jgi:hypothetical protein
MNTIPSFAIFIVIFFLAIFITGFWTHRTVKPYPVLLLTVHKLVSLGALVYLGVTFFQVERGETTWMAGIVAGLAFLSLIGSGSLLSANRPMPGVVTKLHLIVSFIALLASGALVYFLSIT